MTTLFSFLVVLGIIVFVHELGHFVVAKLCDVYVDCFSLGFGPRLLWLKIGETEYRISAIPLGGYVRMAGQEDMPEEHDKKGPNRYDHVPPHRRYDRKAVWQRILIIAAGPSMNIVFALPVAFLLLVYGERGPLVSDATTVGNVLPGSPAAAVDIKKGDRIVAIDGQTIADWDQLARTFRGSIGETAVVRLVRGSMERSIAVVPVVKPPLYIGIGIQPMQRAQVAVVRSNSPAAVAGVRPGDIVDRLVGVSTTDSPLDEVMDAIRQRPNSRIMLSLRRLPETIAIGQIVTGDVRTVAIDVGRAGWFEHLDLSYNAIICADTTPSNFPVQTGDRILRINDRSFVPEDVVDYVHSLPVGDVPVEIERISGGVVKTRMVTNVMLQVKDIGIVGVVFTPAMQRVVYSRKAALKACPLKCRDTMVDTLKVMRIMVTERLGLKALGGPLAIARVTGQAARDGFDTLLALVLLLTINLGVLNLLPFPVLDGGHLVFLTYEGIRRRPLPLRAMLWFQKLGIAVLLMVFALVTYNDAVQWLVDKEGFGLFLGKVREMLVTWFT